MALSGGTRGGYRGVAGYTRTSRPRLARLELSDAPSITPDARPELPKRTKLEEEEDEEDEEEEEEEAEEAEAEEEPRGSWRQTPHPNASTRVLVAGANNTFARMCRIFHRKCYWKYI